MLVLPKGGILVSRVRSSPCPLGLASPSRTCLTTHHRLAGFRLASPPAFHPLSGPPRPSPFSPPLWLPPSRIFIHFSAPSPTTSPLPLLFPPFPISSLLSLLILTPDPAGHCCLTVSHLPPVPEVCHLRFPHQYLCYWLEFYLYGFGHHPVLRGCYGYGPVAVCFRLIFPFSFV